MPAALLLALHACHAASVHAIEPLAEAGLAALRTLLAALPASDDPNGGIVARAVVSTALGLLKATPTAAQPSNTHKPGEQAR